MPRWSPTAKVSAWHWPRNFFLLISGARGARQKFVSMCCIEAPISAEVVRSCVSSFVPAHSLYHDLQPQSPGFLSGLSCNFGRPRIFDFLCSRSRLHVRCMHYSCNFGRPWILDFLSNRSGPHVRCNRLFLPSCRATEVYNETTRTAKLLKCETTLSHIGITSYGSL